MRRKKITTNIDIKTLKQIKYLAIKYNLTYMNEVIELAINNEFNKHLLNILNILSFIIVFNKSLLVFIS